MTIENVTSQPYSVPCILHPLNATYYYFYLSYTAGTVPPLEPIMLTLPEHWSSPICVGFSVTQYSVIFVIYVDFRLCYVFFRLVMVKTFIVLSHDFNRSLCIYLLFRENIVVTMKTILQDISS